MSKCLRVAVIGILGLGFGSAGISGCAEGAATAAEQGTVQQALSFGIDPRRSLAVTDEVILEPFSFERVMKQIVVTSEVPMSAEDLYRQWWDTQNLRADSLVMGANCDDHPLADGNAGLNGFPYTCPRAEGRVVSDRNFFDPSHREGYSPIGLFNRFDLAPEDGTTCGEYRIVFARNSGKLNRTDRNLLIFEAVLPNPNRSWGLEGCRPVVEFWANLSDPTLSISERRDRLEKFYFEGLTGFRPVIHYANYGAELESDYGVMLGGQIRTNQFMTANPQEWNLREFKVVRDCRCKDDCGLVIVPVTVKDNPHGPLFNAQSADPRALGFRDSLFAQLTSLVRPGLGEFTYSNPDKYNSGESIVFPRKATDYGFHADANFRAALTAAISGVSAGRDLTAEHVLNRVQALSCAGCHDLSNGQEVGPDLEWPSSLGFVHVSERFPEDSPEEMGKRFVISPALEDQFLPDRGAKMEAFLKASHKGGDLRDIGSKKLPAELMIDQRLCYVKEFKSWRFLFKWELLRTIEVDVGRRINNQSVH